MKDNRVEQKVKTKFIEDKVKEKSREERELQVCEGDNDKLAEENVDKKGVKEN